MTRPPTRASRVCFQRSCATQPDPSSPSHSSLVTSTAMKSRMFLSPSTGELFSTSTLHPRRKTASPVLALRVAANQYFLLERDSFESTDMDLSGLVLELRGDEPSDLELDDGPSGSAPPRHAGLQAVRPNPFNPRTSISFYVPTAGHVELTVLDLSGRVVRRVCSARPHTPASARSYGMAPMITDSASRPESTSAE